MAIETREKEINGSVYAVTQLPARRAIRLKARLVKLIGPIFAQIYLTIEKKSDQEQKANIINAIENFSSHMNEQEFENLVVDILQGVRKNGVELVPAIIDLEFAGDMVTLYQVIWFVLEVNYADFFSMLGIGNPYEDMKQNPAVTKKTFTRK
jgi:hypothetical protein